MIDTTRMPADLENTDKHIVSGTPHNLNVHVLYTLQEYVLNAD